MTNPARTVPHQHAINTFAKAKTMYAITQGTYGTTSTWTYGPQTRPTIASDQVLIQVRAAGLDRGTWHLMTGKPYALRLALGLRGPKNPIPGFDLAGTVVEVGPDVTRFNVGDQVFGIGIGAFAEFAVAKADKLVLKPTNVTFEQAAALGISGSTALRAVTDVGQVKSGDKVLVIGASGGVGSYAVQIAKALGAHVTGVASAEKADLVRSLGAERVIDYKVDDCTDGRIKYDVIVDIAGNNSIKHLRRALTPTGTLVIVGGEEGEQITGGMGRQLRAMVLSPLVRQRLALVFPKEHFSVLERVAALVEDGSVVPSVDRAYPLAQAASAMDELASGRVRGKLVITM
jgi:NADPH:quinone reductase-like Zn-dependent oxidoreductase